MNYPLVEILLASYNGEKYISEQINSILKQDYENFKILIRDDGSTDKTPEIISEFERDYPDKIKIIRDNKTCKSPGANFFELIRNANAEYIMFSDQDDYWLPQKISVTLKNMLRLENGSPNKNNTPVLVYADSEIVDADLKNPQGVFINEHYQKFSELLSHYCVTGCLMMINKALYKNLGEYKSEMGLHDRWIALYACAMGIIYHVPEVVMLYRQHSENVIGSEIDKVTSLQRIKNFITAPTKKIASFKYEMLKGLNMAKLFKSLYEKNLRPEILNELNNFINLYSKTGMNKFSRVNNLIKSGYIHKDFITALKQIIFI